MHAARKIYKILELPEKTEKLVFKQTGATLQVKLTESVKMSFYACLIPFYNG